MTVCGFSRYLHFGPVCPRDIVPDVLQFIQMQLCKSKLCCHVLFIEKRLSPGTSSKQDMLVQSFSNCTAVNL